MKILFLISKFPPPMVGGATVYLYNIISHLPQGSAAVFTNARAGDAKFDASQEFSITRTTRPVNDFRKLDKILMWVVWLKMLLRLLKRERFDVLHVGDLFKAGLVARVINMLRGTPYVTYIYAEEITAQLSSTDWLSRIRGKIYYEILNNAIGIIGVSDYSLSLLKEIGIHDKPMLKIVPMVQLDKVNHMAAAPDILSMFSIPKTGKYVLCVGRLIERKGQDKLLQAWPDVLNAYADVTLVIVGDGPSRERLHAMAKDLHIMDSIVFTGAVSDDDLSSLYSLCDVFIMPHRQLVNGDTEGCPTVFLEAGLHSKPVIGGNAGGVHDAIIEGVTGLIIDGTKLDDISHAILKLLLDPELARTFGLAARERITMELNPDTAARKIYNFTENLLKFPARPSLNN